MSNPSESRNVLPPCLATNSRRDVGDIAVNLDGRIHHRRARFEPDAGCELRRAGAGVLRMPKPVRSKALRARRRSRARPDNQTTLSARPPTSWRRGRPSPSLLPKWDRDRSQLARAVLGTEPSGNPDRTHQVAEHDGEVAPFAGCFRGRRDWGRGLDRMAFGRSTRQGARTRAPGTYFYGRRLKRCIIN